LNPYGVLGYLSKTYLIKQIDQGAGRPTFVGSFAYSSGLAYGALLDASVANWLKGLTPQDDLGELLQRSLKIEFSPDLKASAEKQASKYGVEVLRPAESEREAAGKNESPNIESGS
jgi:hypothetical protein